MAYKGYKGCGPNKLGASPLKQRSRNRRRTSREDWTEGPDTKLDQQIERGNAYTEAANSGTEFNTDSFYTGGEIFGESNKSRPKQSQYPGNLPGVKTRVEKKKD